MALGQKAQMKRPLAEPIAAAPSSGPRCMASLPLTPQWLPSTLRLSLLVSSGVQGHDYWGTESGWRRPMRGPKEGGWRGLRPSAAHPCWVWGRLHLAGPWVGCGTLVTSGVPVSGGGKSTQIGGGGMRALRRGFGRGWGWGPGMGALAEETPLPPPLSQGPWYNAALGWAGVFHSFILSFIHSSDPPQPPALCPAPTLGTWILSPGRARLTC